MNPDGRISTQGGENLAQNPFAGLSKAGLPEETRSRGGPGTGGGQPAPRATLPGTTGKKDSGRRAEGSRGRVDILRETGGRGGKTVTVVSGFTGIGQPEKEALTKRMRAACGCGGTVKEGRIEIQGDQREAVARILAEAGFRPVFAGG